ncbi:MAG: peptide chain release factor N(5)-glutamine methyltransferase [Synergistaceae bacterium]|nr:peptide chain release factor N(5)-glutamine methyltransferase [Synergistaceae bacterium]
MIVKDLIINVKEKLRSSGIVNAEYEAKILMFKFSGLSEIEIMAHPERNVETPNCMKIFELVERRMKREPLQYILGAAWFWGREFSVGEGVLCPRPETELLVEAALEEDFDSFLDWGTGSGCIAATLLSERPGAHGVAAEVNPLSIIKAYENLRRLGVIDRCVLWHSRSPDDIPVWQTDLIISNPPYIETDKIQSLMPEVQREPFVALDGGSDGLDYYRKLVRYAPTKLRAGGRLLLEIGEGQADYFRNNSFDKLKLNYIRKDFQGIERIASLVLRDENG